MKAGDRVSTNIRMYTYRGVLEEGSECVVVSVEDDDHLGGLINIAYPNGDAIGWTRSKNVRLHPQCMFK